MKTVFENNWHMVLSCPICGGDSILIERVKTINPGSEVEVDLRECISCKHWWHSPLPRQKYLSDLYETASEFVVPKGYETQMKTVSQEMSPKEVLSGFGSWLFGRERRHPGHRYLEIGIGSGHLLAFFLKQGYDGHGIEVGAWALAAENAYSELLSKRVFPSIDLLSLCDYDIIVAADVLEHLEDPLGMLRNLKKKSGKNARLYCSFPNKDSIAARKKRGRWSMVRPLGHLHYFSEQSVNILFTSAGWEIQELRKVNAFHNTLRERLRSAFSSANPIRIAQNTYHSILDIPNSWNDQFWVRAKNN